MAMVWTRKDTIPYAAARCVHCFGCGITGGLWWEQDRKPRNPCHCVTRQIFRLVLKRVRMAMELNHYRHPSRRGNTWGYPLIERIVEFERIVERSGYRKLVYEFHLGDADYRVVAPRLNMSKGQFFHAVYRAESHLGRMLYESGRFRP